MRYFALVLVALSPISACDDEAAAHGGDASSDAATPGDGAAQFDGGRLDSGSSGGGDAGRRHADAALPQVEPDGAIVAADAALPDAGKPDSSDMDAANPDDMDAAKPDDTVADGPWYSVPGFAIATVGGACPKQGIKACAGHASTVVLTCVGTAKTWKDGYNSPCNDSERCDTALGKTQGTCRALEPPCIDKAAGDLVCDPATSTVARGHCDAELIHLLPEETCPSNTHCDSNAGASCICNDGFEIVDGGACSDIDECATDHGGCVQEAQCVNFSGSRWCVCPVATVGDGVAACTPVWTKQFGYASSEEGGSSIATDASGNVYVSGETTVGIDGLETHGFETGGEYDAFIVKYDSAGVRQWGRRIGSSGYDRGFNSVTDSNGNTYLAGYTDRNIGGNVNAGSNSYDLFVVKIDSSGETQWSRQIGSNKSETDAHVALDSSGNVFLAGTAYLGDVDGHTSAGGRDIVLVKYDNAGQKLWSRQFGLSSDEFAYAVATDASGNVFVAGTINLDALVLKYDGDGGLQWIREAALPDAGFVSGAQLRTDASGRVYAAVTQATAPADNTGSWTYASVVLEYDGTGKALNPPPDLRLGVLDSSGNTYTVQSIKGSIDGATSAGGSDVVLTKYDASGQKLWARQHGSSQDDFGSAAAIDPSGNIYVTGATYGGIDGYPIGQLLFDDVFILKYDADGNQL